MGFLNWMNKGAQAAGKSKARLKQPGDPFKIGDRVVVYETWHLGRDFKRESQFSPGIVSAVQHNGTVVSYERGGRLPATAAIEDVRHATEQDLGTYQKEFCALEAKIRMAHGRTPSWER
jgi:hypothetical protein